MSLNRTLAFACAVVGLFSANLPAKAALISTAAVRMQYREQSPSSMLYLAGNHYPMVISPVPVVDSAIGNVFSTQGKELDFESQPLTHLQFFTFSNGGWGGRANFQLSNTPGASFVVDQFPASWPGTWATITNYLDPIGYTHAEIVLDSISRTRDASELYTTVVNFRANFYGEGAAYHLPEPSAAAILLLLTGALLASRCRG